VDWAFLKQFPSAPEDHAESPSSPMKSKVEPPSPSKPTDSNVEPPSSAPLDWTYLKQFPSAPEEDDDDDPHLESSSASTSASLNSRPSGPGGAVGPTDTIWRFGDPSAPSTPAATDTSEKAPPAQADSKAAIEATEAQAQAQTEAQAQSSTEPSEALATEQDPEPDPEQDPGQDPEQGQSPGFSSRYDLNAPKTAKVSRESSQSSADVTTQSTTAPDSVQKDNLMSNKAATDMPSQTVPRKPSATGTHKLMDFTDSLKQEQKKIGSMQTNLERAQILVSLLGSFIVNNAFLVAGITTGLTCGALMLANYALINSKSCYKEGLEHFQKHENYEAIKSLNKAIFFNRYYSNAYIYRGMAYRSTNDPKRAFDDFNQALNLNPTNVEALQERAAVAIKLGLAKTAVDDLAKVEKLKPELLTQKPEVLINFSQAYLLTGYDKLAMAEINECLRHYKTDANVMVQRAKCYQSIKDYQDALIDCKNAVHYDSGNALAHAELGNTYQLLNDYVHDKPELDRALELDPDLAAAHAYLASNLLHFYQFATAISQANQAVKLEGSAKMYCARALLLSRIGDFKGALNDYEKAVSLEDFKPTGEFYLDRADVKAHLSNYDGALKDVSQAATVEPQNRSRYLIKRADIFAASKNYKLALAELDKVLAEDHNNAEALFRHGWYSELSDNRITAMDDYFRAIKADPHNPQAYLRRGISYFDSKQFDSAAADFKQALALDPRLLEAKEKLQTCVYQSKLLAATSPAEIIRPELTKSEQNEIAGMGLQQLLEKGYEALQKQKFEYALAALTKAVREYPNDKTARQYLVHALAVNDQPDLAITQVLALEEMGDLKVEDEIGFVKALRDAGANEQARKLVDHLIEKYGTDGVALALIAKNCSTWEYDDKVAAACDKALKHTPDIEKAGNLKLLRDAAVKKLAEKKLKPAELSIYKAGEGEPSAPP